MNLVLLGAPGAGKGTQANRVSERYNLTHISRGDIFREEIVKGTTLGRTVQDYLKAGRLVPDELATGVVVDRLSRPECARGVLLDGFPRTLSQAESLEAFLTSIGRRLDSVFYLELSESVAIERLSNRRYCENCGQLYNLLTNTPASPESCDGCGGKLIQREDDLPETIKRRLMVYESLTQPLIAYYRSVGILRTIEGNQDINAITAAVFKNLDGICS